MVNRELTWYISADGLSVNPTTPQEGGVQGDHNVTRAIFKVAEGSAWADPANTVYIECVDGAGNVDTTEQLSVVDGTVSYLLPRAWTQYGGVITLRLVAEGPGKEGVLGYSPYAAARLESRQNAMHKVDGLMKGRLAQMEKKMEEQLDRAEDAADTAGASAASAAESYQQAVVQREGAQTFADQAQAAAKKAEEQKAAAGEAATAAVESSMAAAGYANTAGASAASAAESYQQAVVQREGAQTFADQAKAAAAQAQTMVEQNVIPRLTGVEKGLRNVDTGLSSVSTQAINAKKAADAAAEAIEDFDAWRVDADDAISTLLDENESHRVVNVRSYMFGAIGDGKSHPLRERYTSMDWAKDQYPDAESLDDEIDELAIQKALHYAEKKGLPLYIPTGTYIVSKTITTHTRDTEEGKAQQTKNLHIYGSGGGTIIKTTADFEGDYVFYLDVYPTNDRSLWLRDFRIEINADTSGVFLREVGMKGVIENLWIRNYYDGENAKVRCGLWCKSLVVTTIDKVKVSHFSKGCGIVVQTMHSSKIIDCDVTYCGWGIYLSGGSNDQVANCRIDHNEYGVFQNSSSNVELDNRAFPYVEDSEDDELQFKGTFGNFTIRKNRFEGNNKYAIYLVSFSGGDLNYMWNVNTVIAENYFTGLGTAINEKTGALLYDDDGNTIFRSAIRLGRCKDIVIEANDFKGEPYNSANSLSSMQNISNVAGVSNITLRNNSAISCPRMNENGELKIVKTNNHIFTELVNQLKLVDNIEYHQASGVTVNRTCRCNPSIINTSGTIDVSGNSVYKLNDGVTVSGIKIEDGATLTESQEITLVAAGSATVNNTGVICLNGGANFDMQLYDTLTLVRVYHAGAKWVEKCRSVNRAT